MDAINDILVDPKFQAAAVVILTIIIKALWNAVRDTTRGIESSGVKSAKDGVKAQRSMFKPLSRIIIEAARVLAQRKEGIK